MFLALAVIYTIASEPLSYRPDEHHCPHPALVLEANHERLRREQTGRTMRGILKIFLTAIVVLAAAGALAFKYWDYIANPWTRDGQVRANVIQVAPRVSGPIVKLPIKDNQFVKAGDLLFEIDPRTYKAALDQAKRQPRRDPRPPEGPGAAGQGGAGRRSTRAARRSSRRSPR